jgi:hypothetical protein
MIWTRFKNDQGQNPKKGFEAGTEIKSPNRNTGIRMKTRDHQNILENEGRTKKENKNGFGG